jgi:type IV pilus assembly protein PilQ
MRLVLTAAAIALLACGGSQREDDSRPEPGELDLDPPPTAPAPAAAAPPPAAPSSDPPIASAPSRPRFRGAPIDIDVKDADLHNVFRLIAEAGGVSIAVADEVKGTITLRLRQVPWDQALDTVVKLEKLQLERHGDLYLVTR